MIFAAASSQVEVLNYLADSSGIDWRRVDAFQMDEYIGLSQSDSRLFSSFLKSQLFNKVSCGAFFELNTSGKADLVCQEYAELLRGRVIDIVCLGIGENGHIAFNDPHVADFVDPELVKIVELDERSRQQQVNEGLFASLSDVPQHAITLTIPALIAGKCLFCIVPGKRKKQAVADALNGDVSVQCPASILQTHEDCQLFLDLDSSKLLHAGQV